jgi:hypothetical protein
MMEMFALIKMELCFMLIEASYRNVLDFTFGGYGIFSVGFIFDNPVASHSE